MAARGSVSSPTPRVEPLESLDAVRDEWPELARDARNIFATWEWTSSWWRHFGEDGRLLAGVGRSATGSLIAILPLYLSASKPLRIVRFVGHGAADQLGPICAPEQWSRSVGLLRELLAANRSRWDVFLGEQLPGNEPWQRAVGGRALSREGSPVLRASEGWDGYLATRSANLRQQLRRKERRLSRDYELTYRLAEDPSRLQTDLDTLFTLHSSRWSTSESSFAGTRQAFHRDFATTAFDRGWLRLWFLEIDGRPRAAWYGFRFEGAECYYQAGRDMTWPEASVGFVLLAHSIRAALDDGITEYRFLRGSEPFKYRFADNDPGLQTIGVANGVRGRAAVATMAAIGRKLPLAVRRRLIRE